MVMPAKARKRSSGAAVRQRQSGPVIPHDIAYFFEPPSFLPEEYKAHYEKLVNAVKATIRPADSIEWFWVADIVNAIWDAHHLRHLKSALITAWSERREVDGHQSEDVSSFWEVLEKLEPDKQEGALEFLELLRSD